MAGRIENSQIGAFLAYATDRRRTLLDRRLHLPASWTNDRERCRRAGIGDDIAFETKVAIADRIPFRWVTADAAYGFSKGLAVRTRAGRRLPRDGHHPSRHRRHPLGDRPPRGRPVSQLAEAEVETPFLRRRSPRPAGLRPDPRRGATPAPLWTSCSGSPATDGRWRNAARVRSRSAAWTTTRSAAIQAGTAT
ncbi:transposase [Streptomyces sp. NPDC023723]|uniref:transposase n=1 Tax=Streptomyces sp. NPDC023723 TaxID=3154323 RepID=UPI0033E00CA4